VSGQPDEALTGLQAAVAVVTARLHALEEHSSTAEALAVQTALYEELGDDLVTGLSSLAVGLVQLVRSAERPCRGAVEVAGRVAAGRRTEARRGGSVTTW